MLQVRDIKNKCILCNFKAKFRYISDEKQILIKTGERIYAIHKRVINETAINFPYQ